ncbi:Lrp/AsnC family transcriptional regulator [Cochlodiniinecator piscidefendens]|uniref:Lrp/AsnC family transcriptional regulator n=1 Tax=Cochlodiniinecator piscidefendens TaxID=2715756 RepID=UPI0014097342|nr:Lrp/AsnC family transcriptional regulator [Cochlodiniinecator piscidefendens]
MDDMDRKLIAALRRDSRQSLSELAAVLNLSRTTVRSRMEKLQERGVILGFSVVLKGDLQRNPVRGHTMLGIEGRGTDKIVHKLYGFAAVEAVHSTNGKWDLIVELGTKTLEELDQVLAEIRKIEGVMTSETNLLLATKPSGRARRV